MTTRVVTADENFNLAPLYQQRIDAAIEARIDARLDVAGRKHPAGTLQFGAPITGRSPYALSTRTDHTPHGVSYAIDNGWLSKTTDGWVTRTNGLRIIQSGGGWGYGTPVAMVAWSDESFCFVTDVGEIIVMDDMNATPVRTLQAPTTFAIAQNFYEAGGLRIVIAGEYDQGNDNPKNLYLSTDGGHTFNNVRQTEPGSPSNNHWHATAFDPWSGAIWAAAGDNRVPPRQVSYSLDWGQSWASLESPDPDHTGYLQPTLIYPFPRRIVFGRDTWTIAPGLDEWVRPFNVQPQGPQPLTPDRLQFHQHLESYQVYPTASTACQGRTADEAYVLFPQRDTTSPTCIYATGDGGATWHLVHTADVPGAGGGQWLATDGARLIMARSNNPRTLQTAPLLDWEPTAV